jgi:hypothetical protein
MYAVHNHRASAIGDRGPGDGDGTTRAAGATAGEGAGTADFLELGSGHTIREM